ncbi:MAG: hypothetical protein NT051_00840, partial [Candidatus Micrarchaeota archaeon]|nr:hypothetical protein [Candidatus Micrarchaeota archaeon]
MVRIAQALAKLGWEKAVAVAILALALLFPTQIKPFIDTFAFGTSLGKIYAFAVYVLLLAFLRLPFKLEGKHVLLALAVLFAFGLFGQIYYQSQSGTDYGSKTFMFDSRGYTSTHINHIHVSKTSLCLISPSDDFDCARPAIPYLPPFYPQIGMLLLLIAVAACLSYYPSLSSPDKVAYAILSFASLKCALDGGFFNFESIAFFMLIPFL